MQLSRVIFSDPVSLAVNINKNILLILKKIFFRPKMGDNPEIGILGKEGNERRIENNKALGRTFGYLIATFAVLAAFTALGFSIHNFIHTDHVDVHIGEDGTYTGNLEVTGSLTASGLSYPTSDGTADQLIKTDGNGTLSFVTSLGNVSADSDFGTDNVLIRSNGTAKKVQHSGIIISDTDAMSAVTSLTVDNLNLDGNTISSTTGDIGLTPAASGDVNLPVNIGLTFGDDGEKIEGDGTDLTIAGNNINLTAAADVVVPANVGVTFGTGEKIEGDDTDLTVTSGGALNLTATTDVVVPANVGVTFGTGEKIEGNNTDLTVTSGADINLTATEDVNIPASVGLTFGDDGEKIEGDGTDLTIASSGTATVTATGQTIVTNAFTAGSINTGVTSLTATGSITEAAHSGRTLIMADVGGDTLCEFTLPAATGSGAVFKFIVGIVNTSNYLIKVANSSDTISGMVIVQNDDTAGGTASLIAWPTAADSDTITLNGSTSGGLKIGDYILLTDMLTNKYVVSGMLNASGTEITPFSATV